MIGAYRRSGGRSAAPPGGPPVSPCYGDASREVAVEELAAGALTGPQAQTTEDDEPDRD
jgi:hypothetical protein